MAANQRRALSADGKLVILHSEGHEVAITVVDEETNPVQFRINLVVWTDILNWLMTLRQGM